MSVVCTEQLQHKRKISCVRLLYLRELGGKKHRSKEQTEQSVYFCWGKDCLNKSLLRVAIRYKVCNRALHIQCAEQPLPD